MPDMKSEICTLEQEINQLKHTLKLKENELLEFKSQYLKDSTDSTNKYCQHLTPGEVCRYSRQMLVPNMSVHGQIALKNSKVLIVGTGGLGCPCSLYLAAAGVGEISIVDNDEVELSNLHRQILHSEDDLGALKVNSGYETLKRINGNITIIPLKMHANCLTISDLFMKNKYDVVVDGSDNVATRYLLNDVCVLNKVPLVSGSALQMEGQLTIYNYNDGPCYRCLFPVPPPPETVTSCGDGGVLGPVPGTIGVLQALETIKIITKQKDVLSGRMLSFDGSDTTFRNIKLRQRRINCDICGDDPTIKALIDYEQFCGAKADDKVHNISILKGNEQISAKELHNLDISKNLLIDVRSEIEFSMCHLPNSVNIPFNKIDKKEELIELMKHLAPQKVYVICRRGNDSQRAVTILQNLFLNKYNVDFINVKGGLYSYSNEVDKTFPIY